MEKKNTLGIFSRETGLLMTGERALMQKYEGRVYKTPRLADKPEG